MKAATAVLAILVSSSNATSADYYGYYSGELATRWNADGRSMTLLHGYVFTDPAGGQWVASKGSVVDGASIPKFAWSIIGGPFEGKYRNASVIHDVACEQRKRPWEMVHLTFYYAMLASGVEPFKAKVMYLAVYNFGPKWLVGAKWYRQADDRPLPKPLTGLMQTMPSPDPIEVFKQKVAEIEVREKSGNPMTIEELDAMQIPHYKEFWLK